MDKNAYKNLLKKKQKQRRKKKILIVMRIILVGVVVLMSVCLIKMKIWDKFDVLKGSWKYDVYTTYEFDGKGEGCLCIENLHYNYTYSIVGDKLTLDFWDVAVRDCSYTFKVEGNELVIVGGEGTIGGTYELIKQ